MKKQVIIKNKSMINYFLILSTDTGSRLDEVRIFYLHLVKV